MNAITTLFIGIIVSLCVGIGIGFFLAREWTKKRLQTLINSAISGSPQVSTSVNAESLPILFDKLSEQIHQSETLNVKLSEAETRHKILTDNIAASIIIRSNTGKILFASPYTEVLIGYSLNDILSSPDDFFKQLVHPDDVERYERALKIGLTGEAYQFQHRLRHHSGFEMWVDTRTVPIHDADAEVSLLLSVILDVTGTVYFRNQVEEKNRDLKDFTYMVSHDLKGPLFSIKGMLQILTEDLGTDISPDIATTLSHLQTSTTRLEQLIESVLEYSKISSQEIEAETVQLNDVLLDVCADYAKRAKDVDALITIDQNLPAVLGERLKLYQIFANLLGNAIKYRSPKRQLQFSIQPLPSPATRDLVLLIKDNGIGIPRDKLPQIFRPFYRAHGNTIEGTGIGLASVKRLLEKLGGSVALDSDEDVGTTFTVTLKRAT